MGDHPTVQKDDRGAKTDSHFR